MTMPLPLATKVGTTDPKGHRIQARQVKINIFTGNISIQEEKLLKKLIKLVNLFLVELGLEVKIDSRYLAHSCTYTNVLKTARYQDTICTTSSSKHRFQRITGETKSNIQYVKFLHTFNSKDIFN